MIKIKNIFNGAAFKGQNFLSHNIFFKRYYLKQSLTYVQILINL